MKPATRIPAECGILKGGGALDKQHTVLKSKDVWSEVFPFRICLALATDISSRDCFARHLYKIFGSEAYGIRGKINPRGKHSEHPQAKHANTSHKDLGEAPMPWAQGPVAQPGGLCWHDFDIFSLGISSGLPPNDSYGFKWPLRFEETQSTHHRIYTAWIPGPLAQAQPKALSVGVGVALEMNCLRSV